MGKLVFQATLGGQVNLVGPNTASTYDINVPAIAGTMVTTGDTGTVTNTMCASSVYTAPGTIGSGTPNTGAFTTLSASGSVTVSGGTANGVAYLNGSKVLTTGSTLVFDGTNLGLGVTPSAWQSGRKAFQVGYSSMNSYSNSQIQLGANFYYDGTNNKYITTDYATVYQQISGQHQWYTAPSSSGNISFTQAMTLDASGNLLVGTTGSNNNGLQVVSPASSTYLYIGHASGTSSGSSYSTFAYNGSSIGSITQNGTTGVLYNIVSDYRLKEVIGAVSGSGERIDALQPVEYTMKEDGSQHRGFLAHQFQAVYPNSVSGTKDAVDEDGNPIYQQMQPSTAEAMADIFAELKSLRARVAQLEGK